MATNNATNTSNPIAISQGGTNATSMSTSTGIVKYDGTRLVTSSTATIDASNNMVNTAQPAFLAYLGSNDLNVTGDSTTYQLGTNVALTEVYDQGNNFNTNGTFTAPVTGKYYIFCQMLLGQGTSITAGRIIISTSNRDYRNAIFQLSTATSYSFQLSTVADMDASDTAVFTITSTDSGGKIDDLLAGSILQTYVSGFLAC